MKKYLLLLPVAALLAGCGNTGSTEAQLTAADPPVTSETTSEPETEPPTEPTTEPPLSPAEKKLTEMPLRDKVCQMFIVKPEALTGSGVFTCADENIFTPYDSYRVGGFIFFAENFCDSEQSRSMIADLQSCALSYGVGAFMATDEEGGSVTRIQSRLGTEYVNSMAYYGQLGDYDAAFSAGAAIGSYLSDYGINLDLAPVADVNISPYNELGNRIFSSDPAVVAEMSAAVTEGLHSRGVCTALKHFPGLGAGSGNTHYGSVWIDRSHEQLSEAEFTAFSGGIAAGTEFVMVGHQITSAAGDDMPSDLSRIVVTDWLRGELGFDGLAITDSHSMGAVANVYGSSDAAILAVEAGIDVILMPADLSAAVNGISQAVESGRIAEERINESVLKILELKDSIGLL